MAASVPSEIHIRSTQSHESFIFCLSLIEYDQESFILFSQH
jgi:hypothetical protein